MKWLLTLCLMVCFAVVASAACPCGSDCDCSAGGKCPCNVYCSCQGCPARPAGAKPVSDRPVPPGFEDYEWRPDPRGPDGWGLFHRSVPKSPPATGGVIPGPTLPPFPPSRYGPWAAQPQPFPFHQGGCPLPGR